MIECRTLSNGLTVLIKEMHHPRFLLDEKVKAAAFRIHPYRTDTIGALCDLQTMTRDDLVSHYRTYYVPQNAVAVLVGDVDAACALGRIDELFGALPAGHTPPRYRRPEPDQRGERRVIREGAGDVAYLQVVYHIPSVDSPDFVPLLIMKAALTGPGPMSSSGGGGTNRSSRLYRALIETELAAAVSSACVVSLDPYVYDLSITVRAGHTLQEVENALWAELDTLARDEITETELGQAVKQSKAQFAYATERVANQAFWLGWTEYVLSVAGPATNEEE